MFNGPPKRSRKESRLSALPDAFEIPPAGNRQIDALNHLHHLARRAGALGARPFVAAPASNAGVA